LIGVEQLLIEISDCPVAKLAAYDQELGI